MSLFHKIEVLGIWPRKWPNELIIKIKLDTEIFLTANEFGLDRISEKWGSQA